MSDEEDDLDDLMAETSGGWDYKDDDAPPPLTADELDEMIANAAEILAPGAERVEDVGHYAELAGVLEFALDDIPEGEPLGAIVSALSERAWYFALEQHIGMTVWDFKDEYIEAYLQAEDQKKEQLH